MRIAPFRIPLLILCLAVLLAGCAGSSGSSRRAAVPDLVVAFVDADWGGDEIPVSGRCRNCGGQGRSPALRITGVPAGADEVVVAFNDLRVPDLSENGGHGTLAVETDGASEVVLPSVYEETMSLPPGVRSVHKHRCVRYGHQKGAYKAPCGCGSGNVYAAEVRAVRRDGKDLVVLARGEILLGRF